MLLNIIFVVVGGGLGSACRYLFSLLATKWFGSSFAWGSLGVNLGGCLLIGFAFSLVGRNIVSPSIRLFLTTGFLGGLTTFSTYALESVNYINSGGLNLAITNITVNNIGGLIMVVVGIWLGKLVEGNIYYAVKL